jgi:hypothetical protein
MPTCLSDHHISRANVMLENHPSSLDTTISEIVREFNCSHHFIEQFQTPPRILVSAFPLLGGGKTLDVMTSLSGSGTSRCCAWTIHLSESSIATRRCVALSQTASSSGPRWERMGGEGGVSIHLNASAKEAITPLASVTHRT